MTPATRLILAFLAFSTIAMCAARAPGKLASDIAQAESLRREW
jgi:hypothetical protein